MQKKGDRDDNTKNRKFLERQPNSAPSAQRQVDRGGYGQQTAYEQQQAALSRGDSGRWQQDTQVQQQFVMPLQPQSDVPPSWMDQLKQDTMQALADQKGVQFQDISHETAYRTGIAVLVDKMYGLLQKYTAEFNRVAAGTDLYISGTISGDVTEVTRFNRMREVEETATYFRCRFTTRHFALVVRGHSDVVDCYLLPVNVVLGGSQFENSYNPLCVVQVKISDQGMMWRMKDSEPPIETLEQLSMWLFGKLVEETKACL
ncbi:MAG: hypothetical protein SFY67_14590 [Candidatus Melainabacteria bacterium]|nr:hypothetical protein [Candidatus Melainabacteria bacterium]